MQYNLIVLSLQYIAMVMYTLLFYCVVIKYIIYVHTYVHSKFRVALSYQEVFVLRNDSILMPFTSTYIIITILRKQFSISKAA